MVHRVSSAPANFDRRGRRNPPMVLQSIQTARGQARSYPNHNNHRRHQSQQQQQQQHHQHQQQQQEPQRHYQHHQPLALSAYKQVLEDDASADGAIFTPTASAPPVSTTPSKQSLDPIFSPKNHHHHDDDEESDNVAILASPEERRRKAAEENDGGDGEAESCFSVFYQYCKRSPKMVPRLFSIVSFILLPSFVLIGICLMAGWGLTNLEAPLEYDSNDAILAYRLAFEQFEFDSINNDTIDQLLDLPRECWKMYLSNGDSDHHRSKLWAELLNFTDDSIDVPTTTTTKSATLLEGKNETYLLQVATIAMEWFDTSVGDIESFMNECGLRHKEMVQSIIAEQQELSITTDKDKKTEDLTFNWIRCWNETENGSRRPYGATHQQIDASSNQAAFYEHVWRNDQRRLFELYTTDSRPDDGDNVAWERSIAEATGRTECSENIGAASWFWFTIMTTMGYGTQSPETTQGRAMVCLLGFLSVLIFIAVIGNAGNVVTVLFDDAMARCNLQVLSRPLVGCVVWGTVTSTWVMFIANRAHRWWADRIGLDDLDVSYWESVWFASNSITTVGLGDYFFQPEMIFFVDVVRFSLQFLVGFVFLATFLGRFGSFLGTAFAGTVEKINERVRNTSLLTFEQDDFDTINQRNNQTIQLLQEVFQVEIIEAEAAHSYKNLDIVSKEERLLKKLLELKQSEKLHFEHKKNLSYLQAMLLEDEDDEKSLALVQEEEDLLRKLLLKKEIEKKQKQLVTYVGRA